MGFNLESQVEVVIEGDDTGVVYKGGVDPGPGYFFGCGLNIIFEEAVDMLRFDRAAWVGSGRSLVGDGGFKCFMNAMFTPGLGQCFQFYVGWFPFFPLVISANSGHLVQVER